MPFNLEPLRIEVEFDRAELSKSLKEVGKAADQAGKQTDTGFRQGSRGVNSLSSQLTSLKGLLGAIGVAAATAFAVQTVKGFLSAASAAEQLRSRLEVLFQSQEKGNAAFERFKVLATELPFSLNQVANAGTTLASVAGGSVRGLESLLRATANLAAATGLSLEEAAGQVVRVQSAGFAAADLLREKGVRQFVEAQLQIRDVTELSLADQQEAFLKVYGANGVLGNAASKLFNTIEGQFSLVTDAVENFQRDVGEAIVDTGVVQETTAALVELLSDKEFKNQVTETMVALAQVVKNDILPSVKELTPIISFIVKRTLESIGVLLQMLSIVVNTVKLIETGVRGVFGSGGGFKEANEELGNIFGAFQRTLDLITGQEVATALKEQKSAQESLNDELDTTASRIQKVSKETENAAQRITDLIQDIRSATDPIFAAQAQFTGRLSLLQQAAPGLTQEEIKDFSTAIAQDFVKQLAEAEKKVQEERLRLEKETAEETRRVVNEVFRELPENLQRTVVQLRFLEKVPARAAQNAQSNIGREPQNILLDREFLQETEKVLLEGIKAITERLQHAQIALFDLEGQGIFGGPPLGPNTAAVLQERRAQIQAEVETLQRMLEEASGGLSATRDALQLATPNFTERLADTLEAVDIGVNDAITSGIGEGFRAAVRGGGFQGFISSIQNAITDAVIDALVESLISPLVKNALNQFFTSPSAGGAGGTGGGGGWLGAAASVAGALFGGARFGGTVTPQGRILRMAKGGIVPDISGRPFADSVPAMLQPGETVLTREESRRRKEPSPTMHVTINTQSLDPSNAASVIAQQADVIKGIFTEAFNSNSDLRRTVRG